MTFQKVHPWKVGAKSKNIDRFWLVFSNRRASSLPRSFSRCQGVFPHPSHPDQSCRCLSWKWFTWNKESNVSMENIHLLFLWLGFQIMKGWKKLLYYCKPLLQNARSWKLDPNNMFVESSMKVTWMWKCHDDVHKVGSTKNMLGNGLLPQP